MGPGPFVGPAAFVGQCYCGVIVASEAVWGSKFDTNCVVVGSTALRVTGKDSGKIRLVSIRKLPMFILLILGEIEVHNLLV